MIGKIIGTGSYLPKECWDNHQLEKMVDTSDEWIQERTGIIRRHIAKEETTTDMAVKAAQRALEDSGIQAEEIDLIIVCTMTPDRVLPSIACEVQKAVKATKAVGFDLNAACSGFVFAYETALAYMQTGKVKHALLIGAETLSKAVDWQDRGTCILFGDGAGAVVLQAKETALPLSEEMAFSMHSDGEAGEALTCKTGETMFMDGQKVFRFAVRKVPECIEEILKENHIPKESIDFYVLHQANKRIVEAISRRLKEPMEKFPMNLQECGNTSSASIPILLDEMKREQRIPEGCRMIMAGFGAGLSWGAVYTEW